MLSRVADSLFWVSRYIERAENNARILDVNMELMLDFENQSTDLLRRHWEPIIASLEEKNDFYKLYEVADAESVVRFIALDRENPNSILSCLAAARENARTVREQISSEMWEEINRNYLFLRSDRAEELMSNNSYEFFKVVVDGSQKFQGITDATMTHGEGWQFIQVGKSIERADRTSRILDVKYHILLPAGEQVGGNVDLIQWGAVLKSCSGFEAFLKLYRGKMAPWRVAEFLIMHGEFPRSIRFNVDSLDKALHHISGCPRNQYSNPCERLSGRLCSELDYASINEIFRAGLHQFLDGIQFSLNQIGGAITDFYCQWLDAEPGRLEQTKGEGKQIQSLGNMNQTQR